MFIFTFPDRTLPWTISSIVSIIIIKHKLKNLHFIDENIEWKNHFHINNCVLNSSDKEWGRFKGKVFGVVLNSLSSLYALYYTCIEANALSADTVAIIRIEHTDSIIESSKYSDVCFRGAFNKKKTHQRQHAENNKLSAESSWTKIVEIKHTSSLQSKCCLFFTSRHWTDRKSFSGSNAYYDLYPISTSIGKSVEKSSQRLYLKRL